MQQLHHATNQDDNDHQKPRALPLMIQGLRTNPKDPESHILVFDIEALIGKTFTSMFYFYKLERKVECF